MSLKDRVLRLEDRARPPEWPEVKIHLVSVDGRLNPEDPQPDEPLMTIQAGTPERAGSVKWHNENKER